MREYEVVVVGGGPAGASAAKTLASKGVPVCVVDKKIFPRDKLCGGLLTLRSKKVFDRVFQTNWDKVICNTSKGVDFYYKNKFLNSISDYKDVYFTSRRYFDDFLLKLAQNEGATLILGHRVKSIDEKNKKLILNNENPIKYKYLIGADGVNSVIARCLFGSSFDKKNIAFGLETELPYTKHIAKIPNPEIYFGVVTSIPERFLPNALLGGL